MINYLQKLSVSFSPTGEDNQVRKTMTEAFEGLGLDVIYDGLGSTIAYMTSKQHASANKYRPVVMLAAPQDQRGFILVSRSDSSGFNVEFLEKIDLINVVYQKAVIKTRKDKLVKGLLVPRVNKKGTQQSGVCIDWLDFVPEQEGLMDELEIGDLGTLDRSGFRYIECDGYAKSQEDRSCSKDAKVEGAFISTSVLDFVLYRIAELLKDESLDFDIAFATIAHSTIGFRGTKTATDVVKPNCALALEAFDMKEFKSSSFDKRLFCSAFDTTMLPNRDLFDHVVSMGDFNTSVGVGQSDGSFIHKTQQGCPCVCLGLGVLNLASAYEQVYISDIEDLAQAVAQVIRTLNVDDIQRMHHKDYIDG